MSARVVRSSDGRCGAGELINVRLLNRELFARLFKICTCLLRTRQVTGACDQWNNTQRSSPLHGFL